MDVERGAINRLVVPARELETHYLLEFVCPSDAFTTRYCVTTNEGLESGPLLLVFTETDSPTAINGEVSLPPSDWSLTVYGQNSSSNMDASAASRTVHTELIRVNHG